MSHIKRCSISCSPIEVFRTFIFHSSIDLNMNNSLIKYSVFAVLLASGCFKENLHHTEYCNNLITDTLGTNDSCRIFIPSAFTPNGDGMNDIFQAALFNVKTYSIVIYNECNEVMFSGTQPHEGWNPNGNLKHNHTYYVRIQAITNQNNHIGFCGEFVALNCLPSGTDMRDFTFSDQLSYYGAQFNSNEILSPCH